jgi:hypothetical protein
MQAMLNAQRVALKRASLAPASLLNGEAPAPAALAADTYPAPAIIAALPASGAYQEPSALNVLLQRQHQQQQLVTAAAAAVPATLGSAPQLASPSCNAQHHQYLHQQQLAGYALA